MVVVNDMFSNDEDDDEPFDSDATGDVLFNDILYSCSLEKSFSEKITKSSLCIF